MAARIEQLYREFAQKYGTLYPEVCDDLLKITQKAREQKIPKKFPKTVALIDRLSPFSSPNRLIQPIEYIGRFDIALFVDPRVPLRNKVEEIRDSQGNHDRISWLDAIVNITHVPDDPYIAWVRCRQGVNLDQLDIDEEVCPMVEAVAFYLQHPKYFKDTGPGVYATGSRVGDENISPSVLFSGVPEGEFWGLPRWGMHVCKGVYTNRYMNYSMDESLTLSRGKMITKLGTT